MLATPTPCVAWACSTRRLRRCQGCPVKAREWYLKAADAGNAYAMKELAAIYINALGVAEITTKRLSGCKKQANAGDEQALQACRKIFSP